MSKSTNDDAPESHQLPDAIVEGKMIESHKPFCFDQPEKLQFDEGQALIAETVREFETSNHRADYRGALMQFRSLFRAEAFLRPEQYKGLCLLLGIPIDSKESSIAVEIGERLAIAERRVEEPEAFSLLYVATMLSRDEFDRLVEWGRAAEAMDADELRKGIVGELLEGRRPFGTSI